MAARAVAASKASHMVAKTVLARSSACTAPPAGVARALLHQAAGIPLQQRPLPHRRQAAAAGQPVRQRRLVAVSVAAPAAVGPHASPVYGHEVQAAVDAVKLASRLCQVGTQAPPLLGPALSSVPRSSARSGPCGQGAHG